MEQTPPLLQVMLSVEHWVVEACLRTWRHASAHNRPYSEGPLVREVIFSEFDFFSTSLYRSACARGVFLIRCLFGLAFHAAAFRARVPMTFWPGTRRRDVNTIK